MFDVFAAMPSSKLEDYEAICKIGSGSYGVCKKVRRKSDGKMLVWKELDYGLMSDEEKQLLVSEVNLLRQLKHEHIVRYIDRIVDRQHAKIYIVMEYCEGGDLGQVIASHKRQGKHIGESFVWKVLYQVATALMECHQRKAGGHVLHRDIKPANVFMDHFGNLKLGDFGLARVLSHETSFAKTFVGTPYYMSPEQVCKRSYNEKSDVWSLGCLLYELCVLKPPFNGRSQGELARKIKLGRFKPIPSHFSHDLTSIIRVMLQTDDEKRPSVTQILNLPTAIKHFQSSQPNAVIDTKRLEPSELVEVLQRKERELLAREKALKRKEKDLQKQQQNVLSLSKQANEKLARAERLLHQQQTACQGDARVTVTQIPCDGQECWAVNSKENVPRSQILTEQNCVQLPRVLIHSQVPSRQPNQMVDRKRAATKDPHTIRCIKAANHGTIGITGLR